MFEALSYVGIAGNEDDGHTQQSKRELKEKKTNHITKPLSTLLSTVITDYKLHRIGMPAS